MNIPPITTPKKILLACSEYSPLICHEQDLAEFCYNHGNIIKRLGHDIRVVIPAFPSLLEAVTESQLVATLSLTGSDTPIHLHKLEQLAGITCYLVAIPSRYDRKQNPIRSSTGEAWEDNALFYSLFCRAIVSISLNQAKLSWQPDIVHCNNWQTGLVPAMLSQEGNRPATLFTLHNKDKMGNYNPELAYLLGITDSYLKPSGLLSGNQLSFTRGGLAFADWLTIPSPSFATELQTTDFENNLLNHRLDRLNAISYGVDYNQWNPIIDEEITQQFDATSLDKKRINKKWLQKTFGFKGEGRTLLLGYMGNLDDQSIVGFIEQLTSRLVELNGLQLLIAGTGSNKITNQLHTMAKILPGVFVFESTCDKTTQHRILAGCDILLIPESSLPSGYLAMRSLIYGTIPIAKNSGGCADTLTDTNSSTRLKGLATGFLYEGTEESDQFSAVNRALELYSKPRIWWEKLASSAMEKNFDLTDSATQYLALYNEAIDNPGVNPLAQQES